jgi:hypothetical protein
MPLFSTVFKVVLVVARIPAGFGYNTGTGMD